MERMRRRWFSQEQKAELWERWKSGQSPIDIARALERKNKGGVYRILALTGGIAREGDLLSGGQQHAHGYAGRAPIPLACAQ